MKFGKLITFCLLVAALVLILLTDSDKNNTIKLKDNKIYYKNEIAVVLSDEQITANGRTVSTSMSSIYPSHDVIYYEDKDFYDSGYIYGAGTDADKHTSVEAAKVTVVNITQPGVYRLSGELSNGQIRIDLGKKAKSNVNAVVTLVLDNVNINCDIAPAIIFKSVYECDTTNKSRESKRDVDTSAAGANIVIADDSINNINGSHVAKIFKDKEGEKKRWKQDGAVFSYMSMNINGEPQNSGVLNVTSDFEGISTEQHLTVNGGNINIVAQDDGINANNDRISVTTINGGNLRILAGLREEGGDGIDSNGWIVANGGTTISIGYRSTDSGIDNEKGFYANGGTLISYGSHIDWAELDSCQTSFNLEFQEDLSTGDAIIITDTEGNVVFCYDGSKDDVLNPYLSQRNGIVITSPQFEVGQNYNLYVGYSSDEKDNVTGLHSNGLYDVSTISDINAVQQIYYSNDDIKHGGFRYKEDKTYDIPSEDFSMDKIVSSFALITDSTN